MPQDTARAQHFSEQSPVMEARARLDSALGKLEAIIHSRVESAVRRAEDTHAASLQQAETALREWEAAYQTMEEQNTTLQTELETLRDAPASGTADWERERKALQSRIAALETANQQLETRLSNDEEASAEGAQAAEQWQNSCKMLEQQLGMLKDENSQLHSEIHQLRQQAATLEQRNTALAGANRTATDALDEAITMVESLLNGA